MKKTKARKAKSSKPTAQAEFADQGDGIYSRLGKRYVAKRFRSGEPVPWPRGSAGSERAEHGWWDVCAERDVEDIREHVLVAHDEFVSTYKLIEREPESGR